jgi:hypothetical protein
MIKHLNHSPVSEIHINNCARYDFMQNFRSLVSQRRGRAQYNNFIFSSADAARTINCAKTATTPNEHRRRRLM